jgi:hypothetical protein
MLCRYWFMIVIPLSFCSNVLDIIFVITGLLKCAGYWFYHCDYWFVKLSGYWFYHCDYRLVKMCWILVLSL